MVVFYTATIYYYTGTGIQRDPSIYYRAKHRSLHTATTLQSAVTEGEQGPCFTATIYIYYRTKTWCLAGQMAINRLKYEIMHLSTKNGVSETTLKCGFGNTIFRT